MEVAEAFITFLADLFLNSENRAERLIRSQ